MIMYFMPNANSAGLAAIGYLHHYIAFFRSCS